MLKEIPTKIKCPLYYVLFLYQSYYFIRTSTRLFVGPRNAIHVPNTTSLFLSYYLLNKFFLLELLRFEKIQ